MNTPELVFYCQATLLEGPRWSHELQKILCVSIEQERIFVIDDLNQTIQTFKTHGQVGFALFKDSTHIIYAAYEGVYEVNIMTEEQTFLFNANTNKTLRYNDGLFDSRGRILLGTTGYNRFAKDENCLYSANIDGTNIQKIIDNTSISNGIVFSKDDKYLYFIDTPTKKIGRYRYDIKTGNATFDKYIIEIEGNGVPDGMCSDNEGNLYIAEWGGYKVSKWNPNTGKKTFEIPLPVKNVSSCIFGGKAGNTLYITTAMHDDGTKSEPVAGGLFRIDLGENG